MAMTSAAVPARRRVSVLGSTGSIGCSTIDLIGREPERFEVVALTAHRNAVLLADQARRLKAELAVVGDPAAYPTLKQALSGSNIEAAAGPEAVIEAASRSADWIMAAIVGAVGLEPTLRAVGQGSAVALANKESLVCAGRLFLAEVKRSGATLLPVDSEHNAIFQVFDFEHPELVDRIVLTASGGPFRTLTREAMARVTPAQAVAHPNWAMGAKISVDSATLMNKGLELIEAAHLFPIPHDRIDVLVHPQSVVHGMVSFVDGSVLAQMGAADMRIPIAHALAWPRRMATPGARLDLAKVTALTFELPDAERFPALRLARQALHSGGGAPTILNAANEVAVHGFLQGRIGFLDIPAIVEECLRGLDHREPATLSDVEALDQNARRAANAELSRRAS